LLFLYAGVVRKSTRASVIGVGPGSGAGEQHRQALHAVSITCLHPAHGSHLQTSVAPAAVMHMQQL
jgi:hypothetical protein